MKLLPDRVASANVITGYKPGSIQVAGQDWQTSLLLPWEGTVLPWEGASLATLSVAHFEQIAAMGPELVLFGSGATLHFAKPQWLKPLYERRIGCETMDTAAACRTYNLLVAEGRKVVAALLLGTPPAPATT